MKLRPEKGTAPKQMNNDSKNTQKVQRTLKLDSFRFKAQFCHLSALWPWVKQASFSLSLHISHVQDKINKVFLPKLSLKFMVK